MDDARDDGFAALLADLLTRAEAAHLAYQDEHGPTDWPQWYAGYLVRVLGEDQFREDDVLAEILSAAQAHGAYEREIGKRDPDWAHWYAAHMAGPLSRDWRRTAEQFESDWDA